MKKLKISVVNEDYEIILYDKNPEENFYRLMIDGIGTILQKNDGKWKITSFSDVLADEIGKRIIE